MKNILLNHTKRRIFLKGLGILFCIIPVYPLMKMIRNRITYLKKSQATVKVDIELPQGISFFDELIINRESDKYEIFSARCSHLGCRINKIEKNNLVCQCHGSRYSLNGEVLQGPAKQNLKPINFRKDLKNRMIIIENS